MKIKDMSLNEKTEFTRRCIGEAVIQMLKTQEYAEIKVSDVAKRAGVSRTTFYNYYVDLYDALTDYLQILVAEYLLEGERTGKNNYFQQDHIVFSFEFFDRYSEYFLTLAKRRLHAIMFEGINDFVLNHIKAENVSSPYQLYAYAGAILNSFLKWEEDGKRESVEKIAEGLKHFIG